MATTPKILSIDIELNTTDLRSMDAAELNEYTTALYETEAAINEYNESIAKKQLAISKLSALGITEEDIKAVIS